MSDQDGDWARLRFEEAVLTDFHFLLTEYGFAVDARDSSCVAYTRAGTRVVVRHDRRSFELNAIVKPTSLGEAFTAWEIARMHGAPGITARSEYSATSVESVRDGVERLAALLKTYGAPALRGESAEFERLRQFQENESLVFTREGKARWVRNQLDDAWQARNYSRVVALLERIADDLSPSEAKKLAYARRQLDGNDK